MNKHEHMSSEVRYQVILSSISSKIWTSANLPKPVNGEKQICPKHLLKLAQACKNFAKLS